MVNSQLIQQAQHLLGSQPRKILVTGGSGFVGSRLARVLAAAGHEVTATGRNPYRYPIAIENLRFEIADLCERDPIMRRCEGQDLVFHVAAQTTPWGKLESLRAANVLGTQHVVDGCLAAGVQRLIHVSSTAIFFAYRDRFNINDDEPLPPRFACAYAASKAEAETVVRDGVRQGLNATIVRARAVFGPGDTTLLPRLIAAARQGRLRQIGDGTNQIDMTYVDNLVSALILAAVQGDSGAAYTITNDEPVKVWSLVREVLAAVDVDPTLRTVSYPVAKTAAGLLEKLHRWQPHRGEPATTRYTIGLLAKNQTFDITTAKQQLDYHPLVTMKEGIHRTLDAMTARDDRHAEVSVELKAYSTGYTSHPRHHAETGADTGTIRFHAPFFLLVHPQHGMTLIDTGYSPRFVDATRGWPYSIYRRFTPVDARHEWSAVQTLARDGIDPTQIRRIVLTHLHADHVCGLRDFPNADYLVSDDAWRAVRHRRGWGALKRAFLPDLLPNDFGDRLFCLDRFQDPGIGPLGPCHDLFGDGSLRLFDFSGHAKGQLGALVQTGSTERALLVADAVWTSPTMREDLPLTKYACWIADSASEARETKRRLHKFHRQFPDVEIIPTHCPEVAERYRFDAQLEDACKASETSVKIPLTSSP